MEGMVYLLCAATTLACSALLYRGYRRSRARLLLWSSICFALITLENALLFVDLITIPSVSLAVWRMTLALLAIMVLLIGMIWDRP